MLQFRVRSRDTLDLARSERGFVARGGTDRPDDPRFGPMKDLRLGSAVIPPGETMRVVARPPHAGGLLCLWFPLGGSPADVEVERILVDRTTILDPPPVAWETYTRELACPVAANAKIEMDVKNLAPVDRMVVVGLRSG